MGDKELARLYAEHAQPLYAFLCYRTGDRALAEDLLADTFERALRAGRRFDRLKASERTWLYTIALNCARDSARRAAAETRALVRMGSAAHGLPLSDSAFAELERKDALDEALGMLSTEEREVVALRFGADLTLADIASLVGEPRSTVETRIYRSLRKLRTHLGPDF